MKPSSHFPFRRVSGKISIRLMILTAMMAATAGAGWWLGRWGLQASGQSSPDAAVSTGTPSSGKPPGSGPPLPADLQRWISEIEKQKLPSAKTAAAVRLAESLSPAEWPELLRQITRFESTVVRNVLEAAVVRRWAAADPAAAAEWGLKNHPSLAAAAAAEWVRQDSAAALKWYNGLTPEQRFSGWQRGEFYAALLQRDPHACMDLFLAHERDPDFRMDGMEWKIAAFSPEKALELAGRLTNEKLRNSLREAVATEKGRRDPFAAIGWARQQPESEKLLVRVFRQSKPEPGIMIPAFASLTPEKQEELHRETWVWWENADGFATLDALRHAPEGLTEDSRQKLFARSMSTLVKHYDLEESARRLETQFPEFAGKWERWIAEEWSQRDPEEARQWIGTLAPGEARDKAQQAYEKRVAQQSQPKTDPGENMARMIAQSPDRTSAFDGVLALMTPAERQSTWAHVSALPEDQRAAAQSSLISLQSLADPAEAAAWLTPQPGSPPPSPEITSRLAANWALDDAAAAARWVDSLPEGESRKWALWNLTRQWQRVDAPAAQRWAASRQPSDKAVMESSFEGRQP